MRWDGQQSWEGKVGYGVLVVLAGDVYLLSSYLHSPEQRREAQQFSSDCTALAHMPKKEAVVFLELGWEGNWGGRKMEGTAHELSLSK